jgi:hypothetical protein
MCTVTVVPHGGGVRLLCNRDELRSRPEASPPRMHELGQRRAIFPVDPAGGGTWIGCNSAGLAAALLNLNVTSRAATLSAERSRGDIVLNVLRCSSLREAVARICAMDVRAFLPFQVVIIEGRRVVVMAGDSASVTRAGERPLTAPLLFTSSSLGDRLVSGPRRRLFRRLVLRAAGGWLGGQAHFHDHQWAARPEISIRMERHDALTVSRTTIDIGNQGCELRYESPLPVSGKDRVRCSTPH